MSHAILLSTCDRVEIYAGTGMPEQSTARHLFRVAAGLESPLLGESQILAQVRDAYQRALSSGMAFDKNMHALFQSALRAGKRVRTETSIGRGAVSHAQGAMRLLEEEASTILDKSLGQLSLMVIGVNNLSRGFLRFLERRGIRRLYLGNRTFEKAESLAGQSGATAFRLEKIPSLLPFVDAIVSATSAPHLIVKEEHFRGLEPGEGPGLLIDLAVPRDIDPMIAARPGTRLYQVHDIENILVDTVSARRESIGDAERIVEEELRRLYERLSSTRPGK